MIAFILNRRLANELTGKTTIEKSKRALKKLHEARPDNLEAVDRK
jgi:hypothetical protein